MTNKQMIISIGREYGSGGHEIAQKLSEKFDIPLYGRNLLEEIAKAMNIDINTIAKYEEKKRNPFTSRTVRGYSNSPEQNIAELEFALLKSKAADEDSFVIVGRCADELFRDMKVPGLISVFILADYDSRVKRIMERRNFSEKDAKLAIKRHDESRKAYHNHYCKGKWGEATNYDLCINSSRLGVDGTVDVIYKYATQFMSNLK